MGVRVYSDKQRIYVDMDGVLADYEGKANELNTPLDELKKVKHIYLELAVISDAQQALLSLSEKYEIWVLSKCPSKNPNSATDKILWLAEHFPFLSDRIILTSDKGCVGTEKDILIDDHPEWANANNFKGRIITFKNNWCELVELLQKD